MTNDQPNSQPPGSPKKKKSKSREYFNSLLVAVLLAGAVRAFIVEPFKIPSASMVPSLMIGDHIFVNKFAYGIRIPFTKTWFGKYAEPKRGEVIVFIYPEDESLSFIKRVIGVPGDKIHISGDDVYVNGEKLPLDALTVQQTPGDEKQLLVSGEGPLFDAKKFSKLPYYPAWNRYQVFLEKIGEKVHFKQEDKMLTSIEDREIIVPEGKLFVMGDNRDNSRDSREWGFVPRENLVGRAVMIWLSLRKDEDQKIKGIRWERFGKQII